MEAYSTNAIVSHLVEQFLDRIDDLIDKEQAPRDQSVKAKMQINGLMFELDLKIRPVTEEEDARPKA